jgi:predicted dehydrogenase
MKDHTIKKNEVSILLVGIGGYGANYFDALFDETRAGSSRPLRLAGVVDVTAAARDLAKQRNVPFYNSVDEFYADNNADLAVLSTPIHMHCEQIIKCVGSGSNVLCEKPLCATTDEAHKILRAEKENGKFVRVGYQMSFSRAILKLKADIANGLFGRPKSFKAIVHYPRNESYYARNNWAGRKRTADGRLILDSPLHNAVAHHLNNMLFILGDAPDKAVEIATVQAELYRGNPDVDNFDTAALRCVTAGGLNILFYASHCMPFENNLGPICQYRYEHATITHSDEREHETFFAMFDDGTTRRYMPPNNDQIQKMWDCVGAIRGGPLPPSGAEAAAAEVLCVNGAQLSHPIITIPAQYVKRIGESGARSTEVEGLYDMLFRCFDAMLLPSELPEGLRAPWAAPGKVVSASEIVNIDSKL